jgi:phosphodiesterase/alkaline phosphatase D-like protein
MWSRSLFKSLGTRSPVRLRKRARANTERPRPAKRRLVLEELEGRALLSTVFTAVASGDPTSDSAILWTRALDAAAPGPLQLTADISKDPSFGSVAQTINGMTDPNRDYTLKTDATELQSATRYYYRFRSADGQTSGVGTFETAPEATALVPLHFAFSGDADGRWRPYASTANIPAKNYDFFAFLGDTMYEGASTGSPATVDPFQNPSQALADYRRKYLEQLQLVNPGGSSGLKDFFAAQANYTLFDNHELGNKQFINGGAPAGTPAGKGVDATNPANDVNTTGTFINQTPGFKALLRAYDDYQPIRERIVNAPNDPRSDGTQQLYFAQSWGQNSMLFNLDDRSYRDIQIQKPGGVPDTGPRADNPDRTMLGATQLAWLKQSLLDAQAKGIGWKFVAVSSPIDQVPFDYLPQALAITKHWDGGYRAERNELLKFIADNHIDHVVFLTTDDHAVRINELTYLTDPSDPTSVAQVPGCFQILVGPIGAGGPDAVTDHSFANSKSRADSLAMQQQAVGMDPVGLDANFPGLFNVFREGDPDANLLRQPVDFYSPDTFNYADLGVSADGKTLSVKVYGINTFAANTFPEPGTVGPERLILSFQINNAPPARVGSEIVNDGSAQRSMVNSVTVTFDSVVTIDAGAFELRRQDGTMVSLNVATSVVNGRSIAVLTFTGSDIIGGSLADGSYTLTVRADRVHDDVGRELDGDGDRLPGGDRVDGFVRLFGDSDGDGDVDGADRDLFRSTFKTSVGEASYLWYFDFDGDGNVDGQDNGQFSRRFGQY